MYIREPMYNKPPATSACFQPIDDILFLLREIDWPYFLWSVLRVKLVLEYLLVDILLEGDTLVDLLASHNSTTEKKKEYSNS